MKIDDYKILLNVWSKFFNIEIPINLINDNSIIEKIDKKTLFDYFSYYITTYKESHNLNTYNYINKICVINKFKDNKKYKYEILTKDKFETNLEYIDKMKLHKLGDSYEIIITNFPIKLSNNKNIIRQEVIQNIFTSSDTQFYDKNICFSKNDNNVYITDFMYNLINTNLEILLNISKILNNFETGLNINNVSIIPSINISMYGRWYWHDTYSIQNNKTEREKIISYLSNYGDVISIDLVSGEPNIFSKLTNSKTLKELLDYRNTLKHQKTFIKKLMNIYIHSVSTPAKLYSYIKNIIDVNEIKKFEIETGYNLKTLFSKIDIETQKYNEKIIDLYKTNLCIYENNRRIVNPYVPIMSDKDIIKEHRKFLQGGTHDLILNILIEIIKSNYTIIPLWTIHDSFSILVNKSDKSKIENLITNYAQKTKNDITIKIN